MEVIDIWSQSESGYLKYIKIWTLNQRWSHDSETTLRVFQAVLRICYQTPRSHQRSTAALCSYGAINSGLTRTKPYVGVTHKEEGEKIKRWKTEWRRRRGGEREEDVLRLRRAYWSVFVMDWEAACHSRSQRQMELQAGGFAAVPSDWKELNSRNNKNKNKKKKPKGSTGGGGLRLRAAHLIKYSA